MNDPLPPFVLVHGAWQGNWVWERVADRLRAAGHRVYTPSLTGLGERAHLAGPEIDLETHVADVLGVIEHHELSNSVLVGHSYGGMVVGGAADRVPQKIASLVYLDAFIPEAGKSLWDFLPAEAAAAQKNSAKDGWRVARISAAEFRVQGSDDIARLDRRAVDQPLATMDQKSKATGAWRKIPHLAYIRAAGQPRPTFAQFAEVVRKDPAWQYFEVPCGHNVMLDLPDALTGILLGCAARAAQATR
ncbi:MAG TPA: alpha/beta hydrolase [Stellaceae bacterium]|jgi:pimeloyl-ACP methyl ester carboxylesterase